MTALDVFHGNIAGARHVTLPPDVDVAVLTEAYHLDQDFPGFTLVHYSKKHGPEARDIAVLVRHGVQIKRQALKKMTRTWYGPFTLRKRKPRRYVVLVLVKDGIKWPTLAVHFESGGPSGGIKTRGRNKSAWQDSARRSKRWLRRRARGVVIGDMNANGAAIREHVAPKGAHVVMASNVDGVVVKGAQTTLRKLSAPHGMHGWFRARLNSN